MRCDVALVLLVFAGLSSGFRLSTKAVRISVLKRDLEEILRVAVASDPFLPQVKPLNYGEDGSQSELLYVYYQPGSETNPPSVHIKGPNKYIYQDEKNSWCTRDETKDDLSFDGMVFKMELDPSGRTVEAPENYALIFSGSAKINNPDGYYSECSGISYQKADVYMNNFKRTPQTILSLTLNSMVKVSTPLKGIRWVSCGWLCDVLDSQTLVDAWYLPDVFHSSTGSVNPKDFVRIRSLSKVDSPHFARYAVTVTPLLLAHNIQTMKEKVVPKNRKNRPLPIPNRAVFLIYGNNQQLILHFSVSGSVCFNAIFEIPRDFRGSCYGSISARPNKSYEGSWLLSYSSKKQYPVVESPRRNGLLQINNDAVIIKEGDNTENIKKHIGELSYVGILINDKFKGKIMAMGGLMDALCFNLKDEPLTKYKFEFIFTVIRLPIVFSCRAYNFQVGPFGKDSNSDLYFYKVNKYFRFREDGRFKDIELPQFIQFQAHMIEEKRGNVDRSTFGLYELLEDVKLLYSDFREANADDQTNVKDKSETHRPRTVSLIIGDMIVLEAHDEHQEQLTANDFLGRRRFTVSHWVHVRADVECKNKGRMSEFYFNGNSFSSKDFGELEPDDCKVVGQRDDMNQGTIRHTYKKREDFETLLQLVLDKAHQKMKERCWIAVKDYVFSFTLNRVDIDLKGYYDCSSSVFLLAGPFRELFESGSPTNTAGIFYVADENQWVRTKSFLTATHIRWFKNVYDNYGRDNWLTKNLGEPLEMENDWRLKMEPLDYDFGKANLVRKELG